nr:RES family NAD+ phosphorylase [Microbulbifer guangxiensis]
MPGSEDLHYLLATPFRYPPLPWGSRFGRPSENGIFYGSKSVATVLAEAAFYRLRFYRDMVEPPPHPITSYHNVFSAKYRIQQGLALQSTAWEDHRQALTDPSDYRFCHKLGAQLREQGIEGIEFLSARALQSGLISLKTGGTEGINVALFEPRTLLNRAPAQEADVTAETSEDRVTFLVKSGGQVDTREFLQASFTVGGDLPEPA